MKFLAIVFLLVSISCAHNVYLQNDQGNTFKRCGSQDLFIVSSDFSRESQQAVYNGFSYWNDVLNYKAFTYAGPLKDYDNIGIISIRPGYFDSYSAPFGNTRDIYGNRYNAITAWGSDYCVKNNMRFLESGCLFGAEIVIKNECLNNEPEVVETLVRHAIGNILGLANQVKPGTLMDFRMQPEAQHPIDASDESIEAVKTLYSN
jgi:hypothetical protein